MKQFLKSFTLIAATLTICVVVFGAYVRLTDAGLGCPDWPGCYGTLTVPESQSAIENAQTVYPNSPVETGKAWREMIHRYLASALGLLVLTLAGLAWKYKKIIKVSPWLTTGLLALISFQGMLGMWTVTMLLKPAIVSAHLLGGMTTLGLLVWIAYRQWFQERNLGAVFTKQSKSNTQQFFVSNQMHNLIRFSLVIIFLQIFLGGWTSTNYAALACTDFPTCHGAWVPEMDFKDAFHMVRDLGQSADGGNLTLASLTAIQWTHRVGAFVTMIYLGFLALNGLKYAQFQRISVALGFVLIAQIVLGIANLILHLPLVLAVAHNFGAALLVVILVIYNAKITQPRSAYI